MGARYIARYNTSLNLYISRLYRFFLLAIRLGSSLMVMFFCYRAAYFISGFFCRREMTWIAKSV